MKWYVAALGAAFLLLQYRLWFSGDGVSETLRLKQAVAGQRAANEQLSERNRQLAAEVRDLKTGYAALEERARTDLGMVKPNETIYQVSSPDAAARPGDVAAPGNANSPRPSRPPASPAEGVSLTRVAPR